MKLFYYFFRLLKHQALDLTLSPGRAMSESIEISEQSSISSCRCPVAMAWASSFTEFSWLLRLAFLNDFYREAAAGSDVCSKSSSTSKWIFWSTGGKAWIGFILTTYLLFSMGGRNERGDIFTIGKFSNYFSDFFFSEGDWEYMLFERFWFFNLLLFFLALAICWLMFRI
mgnify:CR=1 FL=1